MILEASYFFVPAYFSNLTPPLVSKIPFLNKPLDFGKSYKGKRLLGDNKTIRGIVFAVIVGTLMFLLQKYLYNFPWFANISLFNYQTQTIWLGFLMAFGAIFGDAVESFFKRRRGTGSGKPWIPFDQLDYIVGALLFTSFIFFPEWDLLIVLVIISLILPPITHYTGYLLGITKDKI
jgi:CDP-2,3-bis-(O-geranylgeranyl)-sn-glycerol synthase